MKYALVVILFILSVLLACVIDAVIKLEDEVKDLKETVTQLELTKVDGWGNEDTKVAK